MLTYDLRSITSGNLCRHVGSKLAERQISLRLSVVSPFLDRQHGTESCIIEQIERLACQHGWRIHLYSQRVDQIETIPPSKLHETDGTIIWHRVPEIPGPHLLKYLWWLFANHVQRWRNRRFDGSQTDLTYSPGINCLHPDLVAVHVVFHELFVRAVSEIRITQVPLRTWPRFIHRKLYYKLAILLEKKVYRDPRVRLVAVSNLVAGHLKAFFGRTDVLVIPNAVDTRRFSPSERVSRREKSRQSFGYSDQDFVVLLIGNDWKNKGLYALLRALSLLQDLPIRLLVVGSDDLVLCEPWLATLTSRDRVRFEQPSRDVLSFYAAADSYVGPSLGDAFGMPILEAMACGLPVIASIRMGASELINHGETGFLLSDPQDAWEIAGLIEKLYSHHSLRQKMGRAASEYVHVNCSWDQNITKTREFLECILKDR